MSSAGGSSGSFAGEIDELMLWDHVLTNDQIQSNMFSNLDNNETNSVGYWSFNEGSGSLVLDYSSNNNHGIIYGAEWSDDVPSMNPPIDPPPSYSMRFDGVDDYVSVSNGLFSLDYGAGEDCNYTMAAAIKVEDLSGEGIVLGNGDNSTGLYLRLPLVVKSICILGRKIFIQLQT